MKRKIICISMISLLLLTGVASFAVAAKPIEQNTPVVKSQSDVAKITVSGGLKVKIKVEEITPGTIVNKGYYYSVSIKFGDGTAFSPDFDAYIDNSRESCSTYSLFHYRIWLREVLNSRSGTVQVEVKIRNGNPGDIVQTLNKEGSFSGPFVRI